MKRSIQFVAAAISIHLIGSSPAHARSPQVSSATEGATEGATSGRSRSIGTPAAIVAKFALAREATKYQFETPNGTTFAARNGDFWAKGDRLSVRGSIEGYADSSFILKGDPQSISGWLVLRGEDLAFEYTTNRLGEVRVQQVEVSKIFPRCYHRDLAWSVPAHQARRASLPRRQVRGPEPHIGDYDGQDLHKLQSLPGAKKVIYLDITDEMNGDTPINFDKAELWKSWQAVAAGFSMFDVNVTTDAEVYAAADVVDTGIAKYINEDGRAHAALDAFGTTEYAYVYTTPSSEAEQGYGVGRTALHELGHILGLSHDGGGSGGEYFEGIDEVQWCPIMGNYYIGGFAWGEDALYQWSLGEYDSASNREDDLEIMGAYLPFRTDDIPDVVELVIEDGLVSAEKNRGRIGADADSDAFRFTIRENTGHANLRIDRTEYLGGAMLDVDAAIEDEKGKVIAQSNLPALREAQLDVDLAPGTYTVVIRGGAELTPETGFSAYSSLGYYAIEGTIDGAGDGTSTETDSEETSATTDTESSGATDTTASSDDDDDSAEDGSETATSASDSHSDESADGQTSSGEMSTSSADSDDRSGSDDDDGSESSAESEKDNCSCASNRHESNFFAMVSLMLLAGARRRYRSYLSSAMKF